MQDQGHDAIQLFEQCVDVIEGHGYESKVMFSSVRHPEHVRQALLVGAHVCTMPYSVMKNLCENTLTALGTAQFREHTALMTTRVKDVIRAANPVCEAGETLSSAMVKMTESRLGHGNPRRRKGRRGRRIHGRRPAPQAASGRPADPRQDTGGDWLLGEARTRSIAKACSTTP